jgi:hypothetical protein
LIRLRYGLQALCLNVLPATAAAGVLAPLEAGERHVDLLKQMPCGLVDAVQDFLILALDRLIGEVCDQRIAFMPKVGRDGLAATHQFSTTRKQSGADLGGVLHGRSGRY